MATLRQARGGEYPNVMRAALLAEKAGADGITMHLREDRRHVQDQDLRDVMKACKLPLNMELSLAKDVVALALKLKPAKVCIVPERRQEVTTEGGLDVVANTRKLKKVIAAFQKKKIEVSLFIDPSLRQVQASKTLGADVVELHTGAYANVKGKKRGEELNRLKRAAKLAASLGLKVNAGHGLDYENVGPVAKIPEVEELNIGHFLIAESVFVGLSKAIKEMKRLIKQNSKM